MIHSPSTVFMYRVLLLTLHVLLLGTRCGAKKNHLCPASSCGEIRNISYPFRLKGDPKGCGYPQYELACENNRTILYLYTGRYYVKSIDYNYYYDEDYFNGYITVADDGLQKGNCSSLPHYSLASSDLSSLLIPYHHSWDSLTMTFMKCSQPIASTWYFDTKSCIEGAYSADMPPNSSQMKVYSYVVFGNDLKAQDIKDSCTITMMSLAPDTIG
ncbi:hypothetical protein NL676_038862, partial [Syzygium grande]